MKIVFFGSSEFAAISLKALIGNNHKILCVVTQPDRERGRGLHIGKTAVKILAEENGLNIYQPYKKDLNGQIGLLKGLNADLFVVIAYGMILPKEIIELPKVFSINLHASLLPQYRGASPISRAIINGEHQTGITVIKLSPEMDAGPIISSKRIAITAQDDTLTLGKKLAEAGSKLLIETIGAIEQNQFQLQDQNEKDITFAPKLAKEDGRINWEDNASNIYNLIRGCAGWPGAFTFYKKKILKIIQADIVPPENSKIGIPAGQIILADKTGLIVSTRDGNIALRKVQLEGKKCVSAAEFVSGYRINAGEKFETKK